MGFEALIPLVLEMAKNGFSKENAGDGAMGKLKEAFKMTMDGALDKPNPGTGGGMGGGMGGDMKVIDNGIEGLAASLQQRAQQGSPYGHRASLMGQYGLMNLPRR